MPDIELFGLDIAQIAADVLDGELVTLTLSREAKTQAVDGSVTIDSTTTWTGSGIVDAYSEHWSKLLKEGERLILIIAKTMKDASGVAATVVPQVDDAITDDAAETMEVLGILERDPAAATYLLRCQ